MYYFLEAYFLLYAESQRKQENFTKFPSPRALKRKIMWNFKKTFLYLCDVCHFPFNFEYFCGKKALFIYFTDENRSPDPHITQ